MTAVDLLVARHLRRSIGRIIKRKMSVRVEHNKLVQNTRDVHACNVASIHSKRLMVCRIR